MSENMIFQLAAVAMAIVAFMASLQFVLRFLEIRRDKRASALPSDALEERLDRIERNLDTVAVEVERIAEANRFVAKLLSERSGEKAPSAPNSQGRVVTPH